MKQLLNKKKTKFFMIGVLVVSAIIVYYLFVNINFSFSMAEGLDKPSKLHYFFVERIYKICAKKNLGPELLENIKSGENEHLQNIYIRTLGIVGERNATTYLIMQYSNYQDRADKKSTLYSIIDSLGMIGNEEAIPILERLLENYDKYKIQVTRYSIVRALYLLTGKTYTYSDSSSEKKSITLTKRLENARKVIESTKASKRTFNEMLILDKAFRHPDY